MSTPTAPSPLHAVTEKLESLAALDPPAKTVGKRVRSVLAPGTLKDVVSGTWLGHALHPLLTDVVIGSFVSASILDLVGGKDSETAARRLVGVGLAAYGPTALTGVNDWADSEPSSDAVRRVGLVHAAANGTAATLYALSWRARRDGRRGTGALFGLAGAGALAAGGYLGAHMSYVRGVGVNQTAFDPGPSEWKPALDSSQLREGDVRTAVVGDTPVVLVRTDGRVRALHDRCSHRGCSLGEGGTVVDGTIRCGCHGSRFSLDDGTVQSGPATADQPAFETRELSTVVEVRLSEA
jgi:nitrite reductase/ring-hydroxylating ferredoxin subunit/uncharacterized membrane protein